MISGIPARRGKGKRRAEFCWSAASTHTEIYAPWRGQTPVEKDASRKEPAWRADWWVHWRRVLEIRRVVIWTRKRPRTGSSFCRSLNGGRECSRGTDGGRGMARREVKFLDPSQIPRERKQVTKYGSIVKNESHRIDRD